MPELSKKRHISISKQEEPDRLWMWTANSSCCGKFFWLGRSRNSNWRGVLKTSRWTSERQLGTGECTSAVQSPPWPAPHLPLLSSAQLSSSTIKSLSAVMLFLPPWNFRPYFCQNGYFTDDSQLQTISRIFYLSFYITSRSSCCGQLLPFTSELFRQPRTSSLDVSESSFSVRNMTMWGTSCTACWRSKLSSPHRSRTRLFILDCACLFLCWEAPSASNPEVSNVSLTY